MTTTTAAATRIDGPVQENTDGEGRYSTILESRCGHITAEVQRFDTNSGTTEYVLYGVGLGLSGDALDVTGFSLAEFIERIRSVAGCLTAAAELLEGGTR